MPSGAEKSLRLTSQVVPSQSRETKNALCAVCSHLEFLSLLGRRGDPRFQRHSGPLTADIESECAGNVQGANLETWETSNQVFEPRRSRRMCDRPHVHKTKNESVNSVSDISVTRYVSVHSFPLLGTTEGFFFICLFKWKKGIAHAPRSELGFVGSCDGITLPYYIAGLKEKMKYLKSRLYVVCRECAWLDACVSLGRGTLSLVIGVW